MGEQLTDSPETQSESYTEIFERQCPFYLSLGMSYRDYWFGHAEMCKDYVEAEKLRSERKNYELWLQGLYIYDALTKVSPLFHDLIKHPKAEDYPSEPYNFNPPVEKTPEEVQDNAIDFFRGWASAVNMKLQKKGGNSDVSNQRTDS